MKLLFDLVKANPDTVVQVGVALVVYVAVNVFHSKVGPDKLAAVVADVLTTIMKLVCIAPPPGHAWSFPLTMPKPLLPLDAPLPAPAPSAVLSQGGAPK